MASQHWDKPLLCKTYTNQLKRDDSVIVVSTNCHVWRSAVCIENKVPTDLLWWTVLARTFAFVEPPLCLETLQAAALGQLQNSQRHAVTACKRMISPLLSPDLRISTIQCCCQGLETQGRGQQRRGFENWSSGILEDKNFPRGQQHCCEAVRWDRHELEPDRGTMGNKPPIRHSVIARRWCLIFRMLR